MISLGFEVVFVGLWCFVVWFVVFCVGLWCFVVWFVVFCGGLWCFVVFSATLMMCLLSISDTDMNQDMSRCKIVCAASF